MRRRMLLRHMPCVCGRGVARPAAAAQREEEEKLDEAFDVRDTSRLSCQILMRDELDGMHVTLAPMAR